MNAKTPPPTDEELLQGIAEVARQHLDFDGELTMDTPLIEAMKLDSLRLLTLVVELEDRFLVCLEEGDEDGVETVGDLVAVLRSRLA
ncbi:MAG: acyl carrier protein [Alphaproteobacteria bacterium]|nr:acyl carrier protein [Alphaproteobacteria bacterium]